LTSGNINVNYTITTTSIDTGLAPPVDIESTLTGGNVTNALTDKISKNLPPNSGFTVRVLDVSAPIKTEEVITRTRTSVTTQMSATTTKIDITSLPITATVTETTQQTTMVDSKARAPTTLSNTVYTFSVLLVALMLQE